VVDKNFQQRVRRILESRFGTRVAQEFVLDVAYVGNHGVRIPMDYDLNAAVTFGPLITRKPLNIA